MIIDHTVTAEKAKRKAVDLIRGQRGEMLDVYVVLDRQGRCLEKKVVTIPRPNAVTNALRKEREIPLLRVLALEDLVADLVEKGEI